jgi:hypothetical protein
MHNCVYLLEHSYDSQWINGILWQNRVHKPSPKSPFSMVEFEKSPNATFMMVYGIGFPTLSFLLWEFSKSRQFEVQVQDGPENGEHSPTHWDSDLTTSSCRLLLKNVATRNCTPRDSEFQDLNPNANGLMTHWCFIIFCRFQTILGKTVIVFERDLSMRMIPITSRCYMNAIDFLMSQKGMSYLFYGCPLFFFNIFP